MAPVKSSFSIAADALGSAASSASISAFPRARRSDARQSGSPRPGFPFLLLEDVRGALVGGRAGRRPRSVSTKLCSAFTRASSRTRSSSPPSANTASIRSCRTPASRCWTLSRRRRSREFREPSCRAGAPTSESLRAARLDWRELRARPRSGSDASPLRDDQLDRRQSRPGAARTDPSSRSASGRSRRKRRRVQLVGQRDGDRDRRVGTSPCPTGL